MEANWDPVEGEMEGRDCSVMFNLCQRLFDGGHYRPKIFSGVDETKNLRLSAPDGPSEQHRPSEWCVSDFTGTLRIRPLLLQFDGLVENDESSLVSLQNSGNVGFQAFHEPAAVS